MGVIYNRQEKMDYAESHFRRAVAINGRSSVLQCCLGMACHHHHNQNKEALRILQQVRVKIDARVCLHHTPQSHPTRGQHGDSLLRKRAFVPVQLILVQPQPCTTHPQPPTLQLDPRAIVFPPMECPPDKSTLPQDPLQQLQEMCVCI